MQILLSAGLQPQTVDHLPLLEREDQNPHLQAAHRLLSGASISTGDGNLKHPADLNHHDQDHLHLGQNRHPQGLLHLLVGVPAHKLLVGRILVHQHLVQILVPRGVKIHAHHLVLLHLDGGVLDHHLALLRHKEGILDHHLVLCQDVVHIHLLLGENLVHQNLMVVELVAIQDHHTVEKGLGHL